jgi:hypothetical protein
MVAGIGAFGSVRVFRFEVSYVDLRLSLLNVMYPTIAAPNLLLLPSWLGRRARNVALYGAWAAGSWLAA